MTRRFAILTGTLLCCLAWPGEPARGAAVAGWPPPPSLVREPGEILVPQEPGVQEALRRGHEGLRRFERDHPGWRATIDPWTGSLDRAFGDGLPLDPDPDAEGAGCAFIARYRALFAPGLEEGGSALVFNERGSRRLLDPDPSAPDSAGARVLRFDLTRDGLPVMGADLSLGVREGKVVLVATRALGPVTASSRPRLDAAGAMASLRRALDLAGASPASLMPVKEGSLAFYPRLEPAGAGRALKHHLVWILQVRPEEAPVWESYFAWIDAHDGELLALFPEARNVGACASDPNSARAMVLGGVRPNRADDPEVIQRMPFARVDIGGALVDTDINGRYPYGGGPASGALRGTYFNMHCDNCVLPVQPSATADDSGDLDYGGGGGSAGPPTVGNGFSTPADRTTFFHSNLLRLLLGKWDNAFFEEIEAHVNVDASCNAFSSGYILAFFHSSASCRNTGEIRDVVYHELGHTWDRTDGNDITNGALSEWKGDVMALVMAGDSCVGESFSISGLRTSNCSGVRDIDEKAPGRTDHPLTPAVCATCATLTRSANNCGSGSHCLGEISGQASWHLLQNLLAGADYITGAALPAGNPALSPERARWLLERLLVAGGPPMQTWDPLAAGVSAYDAIMLIDDDNANLADGTPHAAYINAAWNHHGIAESPQIADAAGCAAPADPLVTATVEFDAATGLPAVRLDWAPAAGTSFDVYRNTRNGDAFLPLARGLSAGPYIDVGVQAGDTWRYFVAAVRRTGCADVSPGANVATVTVGTPELRVTGLSVAEVVGASDGDGLIEPGETVAVQVTLGETGGVAGATGVTATLSSASPASPVVSGGPLGYGTIPAGGGAAGPAPFTVFVGPTETCGGRVHAVVSLSGDQGCWLDSFDIVLDSSGACAATPAAFVEVVPGSVSVAGGTGDADGIADNCEAVSVSYQIRNAGSLASGPATALATTGHPGVTLAPSPAACSVANLAPGGTAPCQFGFSLGGASSVLGIPFTLTADSAGNPAPSRLDVRLGAETNPPVFGPRSYGFEGTLEGWTARGGFALSTARASAGARSAHAGSPVTPNICAKLISPALRVGNAGGTLSFRLWGDIEPFSDTWYDRANVHVIDLDTRVHTLIFPTSGFPYNALGNPDVQTCHTIDEAGWAAFIGGFNLETFDLTPFAGRRIQIEINYDTDEGDDREGIYVDEVSITNVADAIPPGDGQPDACLVPEVSPAGAAVPLDVAPLGGGGLRVVWQDLGAGRQYNLYAGSVGTWYSHGFGALSCSGAGSGVTCDGASCALDLTGGAVPGGSVYLLATATAFGIEGTSGFASSGAERPASESTCAP